MNQIEMKYKNCEIGICSRKTLLSADDTLSHSHKNTEITQNRNATQQ